ncbi:GNAT family N-acetyltransferase [Actinosynnema sp. NPDC059797]
MRSDGWHFTEDVDDFLDRAGGFLRSRPALHTTPLTTVERLRRDQADGRAGTTTFGVLESGGEVQAALYRRRTGRLTLTSLSLERVDALVDLLVDFGHTPSAVGADHDTATAFAGAWRRRTGAEPTPGWRVRLHRLGTLTPPRPHPAGRARVLGPRDHEDLVRWCGEFLDAVGEATAASWAESRFADKRFTFWETPDGVPVSLAGSTSVVGGMVRVDPVYTPARLRGRGYAAAVTAEVSRAALASGATDVVLFTDPGNPTSNALYRRLGYVPIAEFTGYDLTGPAHDGATGG